MKLTINSDTNKLIEQTDGETRTIDLYSKEAFDLISYYWLKVGWDQKYSYTFSWMGRPIIQLPEDMLRIQEVIYRVKPDVVIEIGIAHGGSLIYYASLFKAMGTGGRVIGIDIGIRDHNRKAIESHEFFPCITLIEGNSVEEATINKVRSQLKPNETVLVILDSNHTKQHVLDELDAYHGLVTPGSYIIATDGIMKYLCDVPRGGSDWDWNNPFAAAAEFAQKHPEFVIEQPAWPFSESELNVNVTYWPGAWLRRS